MIFPEYKKLVKQSESFSLEERVKANSELEKFKSEEPRQAWYYTKWLADEQQGKDPLTSKAVQKVQEPTEAVKPTMVTSPAKTVKKPVSKPTMSYEKFKKTFNKMCDDAKLLNVGSKSPIRVLSEFRNKNPKLYDEYKQRMEDDD